MDKQAALDALTEALGEVITAGLNEIAQQNQGAAVRIGQLLDSDQIYFHIDCHIFPLTVKVDMVRRDGTEKPIRLFETKTALDKLN